MYRHGDFFSCVSHSCAALTYLSISSKTEGLLIASPEWWLHRVDNPAVGPYLSRFAGHDIPHFNHGRHKGREEGLFVIAEYSDNLPCPMIVRVERLVRIQEPPSVYQVLEVLIVEKAGRRVESAGHFVIAAEWTKFIQFLAVFEVHMRIRASGTGLIVEAEEDGEAAALADGVGAGEGDQVGDGEVVAVEEVDQVRCVRPGARHYPVGVLLAGGQAVLPSQLDCPNRSTTLSNFRYQIYRYIID